MNQQICFQGVCTKVINAAGAIGHISQDEHMLGVSKPASRVHHMSAKHKQCQPSSRHEASICSVISRAIRIGRSTCKLRDPLSCTHTSPECQISHRHTSTVPLGTAGQHAWPLSA